MKAAFGWDDTERKGNERKAAKWKQSTYSNPHLCAGHDSCVSATLLVETREKNEKTRKREWLKSKKRRRL